MLHKLIIGAFVVLFLNSCSTSFFEDNLSQILGVQAEIENVQTFNESAGIHGDGFILEKYKLSEKTIKTFIEKPFQDLPDKTEGGKHYQKYNWSKDAIDSSYNEIFIMCLNYASDNEKIKVQLNEINNVLKKKEIYYSFYFIPNKENPQNVQLFILDVQCQRLYAIDQQI
jgi:hypothetical protein